MMDHFINKLDPVKFRKTNAPWNELMLNDPWSVGYVTTLILLKPFANKEEWEEFYYEMGAYRQKKLQELPEAQVALLNDEQLIRTNRKTTTSLGELRNLNTQNGRTKKELEKKGQILHYHIRERHPEISLQECVEAVRFRVICETWNGIILREKNTVKTLEGKFPNLDFRSTTGEEDHRYAVDFEVYKGLRRVCGIQIKPKSYTFDSPYLRRAKAANRQKFENYRKEFGVPVFTLIAQTSGEIISTAEWAQFEERLKQC